MRGARGHSAPRASRPGQRIEKRASFRTPDLGGASGYGLAPTGQAARLRRRESITGWRGLRKQSRSARRDPPAPSPTRGEERACFGSAAALAGLDVEVAAGERLAPIGNQIARTL